MYLGNDLFFTFCSVQILSFQEIFKGVIFHEKKF